MSEWVEEMDLYMFTSCVCFSHLADRTLRLQLVHPSSLSSYQHYHLLSLYYYCALYACHSSNGTAKWIIVWIDTMPPRMDGQVELLVLPPLLRAAVDCFPWLLLYISLSSSTDCGPKVIIRYVGWHKVQRSRCVDSSVVLYPLSASFSFSTSHCGGYFYLLVSWASGK